MPRQKKTALCPAGMVGVGGKWKFGILYHLLSGTRRFGELQRLLPQASRQMLTIQLRELEQMGIVQRQAYVQVPPKVEYSLTELAWGLEPVFRQVYAWGKWYCDQVGLEFDWPVDDETEGGRTSQSTKSIKKEPPPTNYSQLPEQTYHYPHSPPQPSSTSQPSESTFPPTVSQASQSSDKE